MRLVKLWGIDGLSVLQWSGIMRFGAILITSVILPWLGLSGNDLAMVESWLFVQNMLSFFWINAINTSLFRIPEADRQRLDSVAGLSNLAGRLSVLISIPACLFLFSLLPQSENLPLILLLFALSVSFQAGSALLDSLLYQKSAYLKLFLLSSLLNTSLVVGSAIIAYSGMNLIYLLVFWTVISAIRYLLFYFEKPREENPKASGDYLRMLSELKPLMLLSALGGASEYVCGLAVRYGLGADDFVLFRYGSREFPLILIMAGAISNAMSGKVAGNQIAGMAELRSRTASLLPLAFIITAGLMLISPFLFKTFLPKNLAQAWPVFCTSLLLTIPRTLFPQTVVLGLRRDRLILESLAVELVVLITLLIALLPLAGIMAAPFALFLAFLADKLYLAFCLKRSGIEYQQYTPTGRWLLFSLALLLIWGLMLMFA